MINQETQKIKNFLRQQIKWMIQGHIDKANLLDKIADCKNNYPNFDYEVEYHLIVEELKAEIKETS